ncbi:MAG: DUF3419 family protein [Zhengella sp.]|uniref:DUF3419 family protein n=1 Tax=Zhengella sp. TaxID=2282762 RepID=UPI003528D661|nr:DUF3419 family protein [Brucellaceae bacterium]
MTDATALTVGKRLGEAVHQNPALSLDGLLERIFSRAFRGLVYPQIWEDPVVDMEALDIRPHHEMVCIASGSCNVLSYVTAGPRSITAVDLSPAHVALGRLKIAAALHLPGPGDFMRFFGHGDDPVNVIAYERFIADNLDRQTRDWWERRGLDGRRRISMFARGFHRQGLLGRFIFAGHMLARLHGVDPRDLTACTTLEEQARFFEEKLSPLFDRPFVRFLTSRRASLFGLGIPPAQYEALAGPDGDMAEVLRERTRKLACGFPLSDNYFAWQGFARGYDRGAGASLPPYLERAKFRALRANARCVRVLNESVTDHLRALPAASRHAYVLLDAQDWMTDRQLNDLWSEITRTAATGARVIFRTAAEPTLLPGRVDDAILSQWTYRESQSEDLTRRDRSAIYGGFHLYVKER